MIDETVTSRLSNLETMFEKIMGALHNVAPVVDLIPGVATVFNEAVAVGDVVEHIIDPATIAANRIAVSTGNSTLDARLESIESALELAQPLLHYLAAQFGFDQVHGFVSPATSMAGSSLGDAGAANAANTVTNAG